MGEICMTCGLPKEICVCEDIAREQQDISIYTATRRYGKKVTIVEGIDANAIDVRSLAKILKSRCASGGTVKDGRIELQGDHVKKVKEELIRQGFSIGD